MPDKQRLAATTTALEFTRPVVDFNADDWSGASETEAARHVQDESERCLAAYDAKPSLVREHANIERATAQGGYGHRQLYELVQNGADALVNRIGGRIEVVLTPGALYCANEGDPIDHWGVEAILSSHVSMKRGTEIGRFGLGFKSVLGVSHTPQFFSRTACFGFDADYAAGRIRRVVPDAQRTRVSRCLWNLGDGPTVASGLIIRLGCDSLAVSLIRQLIYRASRSSSKVTGSPQHGDVPPGPMRRMNVWQSSQN
ncbi:MAG: sacsin N-terminal ATP-binding-like domain-containing protein [Mycobacteriales bacterium]